MCNKHESDWETTSCSFSCKGPFNGKRALTTGRGGGGTTQRGRAEEGFAGQPRGQLRVNHELLHVGNERALAGRATHGAAPVDVGREEGASAVRCQVEQHRQQHMSRVAVAAVAAAEPAGHEGQLR